MQALYEKLAEHRRFLTGFILPKYDLSNALAYTKVLRNLGPEASEPEPLYVMPILETPGIAYKESRQEVLLELRRVLRQVRRHVLTVRVGGNDFCNIFGVRRSVCQSIYDIGTVREILFDILNIFGRDYFVSAPVWEYFDTGRSQAWQTGLLQETVLDKLNGFIGKTAIHPSQLPVIAKGMGVTSKDYTDAVQILNWAPAALGVAKSEDSGRMNEVRVHETWAKRTLRLAETYGVEESLK
jgi:citrate lyase beta subunit